MSQAPRDAEADLVTALSSLSVPVSTKVPNPRPASFIRVTRAGGGRQNIIQERPLLIVECWAGGDVSAFELAQQAWSTLDDLYGLGADLSSPVWFPDVESGSPRYQFTAQPFLALQEVS
jgi:hypothetical protein